MIKRQSPSSRGKDLSETMSLPRLNSHHLHFGLSSEHFHLSVRDFLTDIKCYQLSVSNHIHKDSNLLLSNFNQEISIPYSLPHRFDDFYIYFPRNLRDGSFRMQWFCCRCFHILLPRSLVSQYSDKETKAESSKAAGRKGKI